MRELRELIEIGNDINNALADIEEILDNFPFLPTPTPPTIAVKGKVASARFPAYRNGGVTVIRFLIMIDGTVFEGFSSAGHKLCLLHNTFGYDPRGQVFLDMYDRIKDWGQKTLRSLRARLERQRAIWNTNGHYDALSRYAVGVAMRHKIPYVLDPRDPVSVDVFLNAVLIKLTRQIRAANYRGLAYVLSSRRFYIIGLRWVLPDALEGTTAYLYPYLYQRISDYSVNPKLALWLLRSMANALRFLAWMNSR